MADTASMALEELLRKAQLSEDVDFLRESVRVMAQALMEVEVTQQVGDPGNFYVGVDSGASSQSAPTLLRD